MKREGLNDISIMALRCFAAVVETRSFSSAARQLRTSPSSVTRLVQSIEQEFGVALLRRTTRDVSVTDAGERFYGQCLSVLALLDGACSVISGQQSVRGHLRVACTPSFAATVLGPNLPKFLKRYPALAIDVMVSSAHIDLVRDRIDVAITIQEEPETKLSHLLIAQSDRVLCAAPSYLSVAGSPETVEDLNSHELLSNRISDLAEPLTLRYEGQWHAVKMKSRLLSNNGEILRLACLGGAGIGLFYRFHIAQELAEGTLITVLPQASVRPKALFAVLPHRDLVGPSANAFIAFIRELVIPPQSD